MSIWKKIKEFVGIYEPKPAVTEPAKIIVQDTVKVGTKSKAKTVKVVREKKAVAPAEKKVAAAKKPRAPRKPKSAPTA
jgi:hypothetical protein